MIPATPPSMASTASCDIDEGKNRAATTTARGSAKPETVASITALNFDLVTKYIGRATATPSGMLCSVIAAARVVPKDVDCCKGQP